MKKSKAISIIVLLAALLTACSRQDGGIEYFPFRTEKSNFWGMMDTEGNVLFEGKFMFAPGAASRGVFMVLEEEGKFAFYTATEEPQRINDEVYEIAKPFRYSDYTPVRCLEARHFTIIDKQGLHVAELSDSIIDIGFFANELAPFVTDSTRPRMGYLNTRGEVVIPAQYTLATNFVCGVALAEKMIKGIPSLSVINTQGKELYTFGNEWQPLATEYSDGLLPVINIRGEIGFLDTTGKLSIAPSDDWSMCFPTNPNTIPYTFKAGHCIYCDGLYYGLMNKKGEITVTAQYLNIYPGEGGLFVAQNKRGKWGCIDSKGKEVIAFEHAHGVIMPSITPHTIVMQNTGGRYRLVDAKGEVISKPFAQYQIK